jgi:hypothetical protein
VQDVNNRKQPNRASIVVWVIILVVIMLYNFSGDFGGNFDPEVLVPVFIGIAFTAFAAALIIGLTKGKSGKSVEKKHSAVELHRPFPQPTAVKAKQASPLFRHKDDAEAEEAVTCAHRTGKEKYLEQVEGFYRNGLIDRVISTNLTYRKPELAQTEWFIEADMSKYISFIIATLNHDRSLSKLLNPHDRIHALIKRYNNEQMAAGIRLV